MSDIVSQLRRAALRPGCSMPETAEEAAEVIIDLREQVEKLTKDRKDAERFRFLLEDHADLETRIKIRELCSRLPVMSLSTARAEIDAAMEDKR